MLALIVLLISIGIGTAVGGGTAQAAGNVIGFTAFVGITAWSKARRHQPDQ